MTYQLVTTRTSQNYSSAANVPKHYGRARIVESITIHHWGIDGQSFANVVDWLCRKDGSSSAHDVVEAGRVAPIVDGDDAAWHAGRDANPVSYGIECRPEATDADYATVAERVRDVRKRYGDIPLVPHSSWVATACPGRWDLARLDRMARQLDKQEETPVSKFVSPVQGRISGEWGWRVHPITKRRNNFHRGIDIAAPTGRKLRAAYGGTVRAISRNQNKRGNAITGTWNSGRFVLIDGPGGGSEWYGHMNTISVRPGQRVKAGQVIGTVGASGNVTGPHCHLEMWNGRYQGGGNGAGNTRNPRVDFRKYGVTPGSAPKVKAPSRPTPTKPPKPSKKPGYSKTVYNDQKWLAGIGFYHGAIDGIAGPVWKRGVRAWQRAQSYAPGLKADGVFGPASRAHRAWTRKLQKALNRWKGRNLKVDGDLRGNTFRRVREVQYNNRRGTYRRGKVDSIPGRVFSRMVGIPAHPGLKR